MFSLVLPAIEYDLHGFWAGKDGQPFKYGAGHEMRFFGFCDFVAASAHWFYPVGFSFYFRAFSFRLSFPRSAWECGLHRSAVRDAERPLLHSLAERGND